MFSVSHPFPGIYHITDAMGVSFTLIEGTERALLFDTGYGTENVSDYINTLTDKPLKVLLSHGHHDHMLGARWFPETFLCAEDFEEFRERSGIAQRTRIKEQAEENGVPVPDDFLSAEIPIPKAICFSGEIAGFDHTEEALGDMNVQIFRVPGHTPGSIMAYIRKYGLLLTGDDWNPCTWMWFPSSLAADRWRNRMLAFLRMIGTEQKGTVEKVFCSHRPMIREGSELKAFLSYMTDERLKEAPAVDMGSPIRTHQIRKDPEDWTLIFDKDKI